MTQNIPEFRAYLLSPNTVAWSSSRWEGTASGGSSKSMLADIPDMFNLSRLMPYTAIKHHLRSLTTTHRPTHCCLSHFQTDNKSSLCLLYQFLCFFPQSKIQKVGDWLTVPVTEKLNTVVQRYQVSKSQCTCEDTRDKSSYSFIIFWTSASPLHNISFWILEAHDLCWMTWNRLLTSSNLDTTSIFCLQNNFRNLHFTALRAVLLNATQDMSNGDISLPANFEAKILPSSHYRPVWFIFLKSNLSWLNHDKRLFHKLRHAGPAKGR